MLKKSLLVASLFATSLANAEILTTIKPLAFIANAVADGVTETKVLLPTSASPHDYNLKPSDVGSLKQADLVVWVGEGLESFLTKSISHLPPEKVLSLDEVPAILEIVNTTKKDDDHGHGDHKHEHAHHGHDHSRDWHIWLSTDIATLTAEQIAERLSEKFPAQKSKIAENLANFKANLTASQTEIAQQLAPVKAKGYYTFHEAYGYFERANGLNPLGSFTINPTVAPGAKTLAAIKKDVEAHKAVCLFAEPQFTPRVIDGLTKGTSVNVGKLDPLGADIPMSKTAYPEFLKALANEFSRCLTSK